MIDSIFDPTMGSLENSIRNSAKAQEVISHNIANANTPGYVPKKFDEVLGKAVEKRDRASVNMEEEMADMARNSGRYSAYLKMFNSKLSVLRTIISQGRK